MVDRTPIVPDATARLIEFWAGHSESGEHGWIHLRDIAILGELPERRVRFDRPSDPEGEIDEALDPRNRIQARLIPQPFVGDLRAPEVVVCLTNPGFGPGDYAAERAATGFAERKMANLRQELSDADYPFFEIDPAFAASPAFGWWFPKLRPTIDCIARQSGRSRWEVAREVATRVACVELFPYHSKATEGWLDGLVARLPSSLAAQEYVRERALAGATVLVCRRHRVWRGAIRASLQMTNVVDAHGQTISFSPRTNGGNVLIRALGYDPQGC